MTNKTADKPARMTHDEAREILEGIARDPECYPRDRIAAVRALKEMEDELAAGSSSFDDIDQLAKRRRGKRVK